MIVPRARMMVAVALLIYGAAAGGTTTDGSAALVHPQTGFNQRTNFEQQVAAAKSTMLRDPSEARRRADEASALANAEPPSRERSVALAKAGWLSGEASLRMNDLDRADPDVRAALRTVEQLVPGTLLHGDLLLSLGGIDSARSAPDRALQDYQAAYAIFKRLGNARQQAIALQDIGSIYQDAEDDERVLYYYSQASETYSADPALALSIANNRANALARLGRRALADQEHRRALRIAVDLKSPLLQAIILNALARSLSDAGNVGAARATIDAGLLLLRNREAARWRSQLLGTAAQVALDEGRTNEAVDLVGQALASSSANPNPQADRSLHDTAYLVYKRAGKSREALAELETLRRLEDQARRLAASTNSALLAARFDFANQNARIATLRTGQLQRDIEVTRLQAQQTQIVLGGALVIVIVGLAFLAISLRSTRRSRDAIAAANAELTVTNAHLEEALRAKSKFLATTSHEIRTPLNGILGMAQVILADPALAAGVRERIELLQGAGTTMRALVDDILDFASLDAGRLDIQRSDIDLRALLREITEFWRGPATKAGLDLVLEMNADLDIVNEDARRLRQILFNLVSNAIKFTHDGRVTLVAKAEPVDGGESLVLAVADSGIGIPPDQLEKVFEEFHQVDTGRARQFSGSGLGLAISRALAAAMGGTIGVASVEGEGSTFTLRLPLRRVERAVPQPVAANSDAPRGLKTARIVVAGAGPLAESTLRAILAPRVASFAAMFDIADAATRCTAEPIDLVLVEGGSIQSSDDGLERLDALVAATRASGTPVAVLWKPDRPLLYARFGQSIKIIQKPIGGDDLVALLESIIAAAPRAAAADDRIDADHGQTIARARVAVA